MFFFSYLIRLLGKYFFFCSCAGLERKVEAIDTLGPTPLTEITLSRVSKVYTFFYCGRRNATINMSYCCRPLGRRDLFDSHTFASLS